MIMMKNKRILIGLLVILVVISIILVSGCGQEEPKKEWEIGSDKYVFVDHHIHIHGELIEGEYPFMFIDFPTYSFDKETSTLRGMIDFDINATLKIVYGSGSSLSGCVGSGAGTVLSGVYELPYEHDGLKIVKIEPDGTAHIEYNGVSIILNTGEELVNTISKIDAQQFGDQIGKANLTITDRIVNYGILDKSKIEKW
jgi:hypothetical protein